MSLVYERIVGYISTKDIETRRILNTKDIEYEGYLSTEAIKVHKIWNT